MRYFLAKNDKQLGICLRMLYAEGIQGIVETCVNSKDKIEFRIKINEASKFEKLNKLYETLIS